jgi:hypothetical protein
LIGNDELIDNAFHTLKDESIEYNWKYRQKICVNCIGTKQQQDRDCYMPKDGKVRVINNVLIPETHCDHLINARANKFRGRVDNLLNLAHFNISGKGKYSQS